MKATLEEDVISTEGLDSDMHRDEGTGFLLREPAIGELGVSANHYCEGLPFSGERTLTAQERRVLRKTYLVSKITSLLLINIGVFLVVRYSVIRMAGESALPSVVGCAVVVAGLMYHHRLTLGYRAAIQDGVVLLFSKPHRRQMLRSIKPGYEKLELTRTGRFAVQNENHTLGDYVLRRPKIVDVTPRGPSPHVLSKEEKAELAEHVDRLRMDILKHPIKVWLIAFLVTGLYSHVLEWTFVEAVWRTLGASILLSFCCSFGMGSLGRLFALKRALKEPRLYQNGESLHLTSGVPWTDGEFAADWRSSR